MTDQGAVHDRLRDAAGLYVLGALDAAEHEEFVAHLRTCTACAEEVRSLRGVAAALPYAVAAVDPLPGLRSRILAVTGRESSTGSTVAILAPRATPQAPARLSGWLSAAAAALLVISLGLGAYTTSLRQQIVKLQAEIRDVVARLDRSETQVAVATSAVSAAESRMAVLTAPDLARVDLQGQTVAPRASGHAFWSRSRGLVFTASDLPPLPQGRAYQLWVVTAQAPVSAGLLQLDAGGHVTQAFATPVDILPPVAMAVTLEPETGVPAPTGEKYLVGLAH